jgi:hypothetical protein
MGACARRAESGVVYSPEECLTAREVLRIHTMGSAYAGFAETMTNVMLGGAFVVLTWILVAVGVRRMTKG